MSEPGPKIRRLRLRATISASEDPSRVLAAMRAVLGDCDYSVDEPPGMILIHSESSRCLQKLHDQLRDRRVRDAARRLMLASIEGSILPLKLNRQAAAAGVLALCSNAIESPLGPINMEIETDSPERLVDWLTAH
jgi:predicted RNA binding protein with dsRBD fold (UPF0201 family)